MKEDELRNTITELLSELGTSTSDELISHLLMNKNINVDAKTLRKVISQLIREGIILKIPDAGKKKFILRLSVIKP
ncbi:MAG: hypothetical protein J7J20_00930 [Desulfurococcales archaeon]|nr:hypothetical protein [Desulfurococcales archaeon]